MNNRAFLFQTLGSSASMPAVARAVTQFHHSLIRSYRRGQTPQWQDKIPVSFRGTTVLGFDVIRSSYGFFPHFLVEVSEEDVLAKLGALATKRIQTSIILTHPYYALR